MKVDLGTRGTNLRGTTFGARNLEHMLLGHTANGAQSQKGHRVMEHNHWGTLPKYLKPSGVQGISEVFYKFIQYCSLGVSWVNNYEYLVIRLYGIRYVYTCILMRY